MTINDPELDQAIDAVAREMMNAEAPAGLRARVLARIDDGRQPGGFGMPRWAWASALMLVIATSVGVWLSVPVVHQPQPEGAVASATNEHPPIVERATPAIMGTPASAPTQVASATRPRAGATARAQQLQPGLSWDAGPQPLAYPDPIAIGTLAPDALAVSELSVAPLGEIQPITIQTASPGLPEPQRRDSR